MQVLNAMKREAEVEEFDVEILSRFHVCAFQIEMLQVKLPYP